MMKTEGSGSISQGMDPRICLTVIYLTWNVLEDLAASCDGESPEQGDAARHPSDLGIY